MCLYFHLCLHESPLFVQQGTCLISICHLIHTLTQFLKLQDPFWTYLLDSNLFPEPGSEKIIHWLGPVASRNSFWVNYSCNKKTKTWIQISRQSWFGFFLNQKVKKFALNLQLKPNQILANDVQMLILGFSYNITPVKPISIRNYFTAL